MLITLLIWFYISALSLTYGVFFLNLLSVKLNRRKNQLSFFGYTILIGFCLLIFLATLLSLFMKIGLAANIVALTGGLIIIFFRHRDLINLSKYSAFSFKKMNKAAILIFAILLVFLFLRATDDPISYDTGLYHAQAIRWVEEYRAVPGLVNLHARLAYDSSWFIISAFSGFSFLGHQSLHALNGWIFGLSLLYMIEGLNQLLKREYAISASVKTLLLLFFFNLASFGIAPPNPDVSAALLIWLIILFALHRVEDKEIETNLFAYALILFSITAVTIKISTAPILLLAVFSFVGKDIRGKIPFTRLILFGCLLLLPIIVRNIITSGYPAFPLPLPGFSFLSWTPSSAMARDNLDSIRSWARLPGVPAADVFRLNLTDWLPIWFRTQAPFNKIILLADLVMLIFYLPLALFLLGHKSKKMESFSRYWPIYLTVTCCFIYWFYAAPDVRFGYGFVSILLALLVAPIFIWLLNAHFRFVFSCFSVLIFFFARQTAINQVRDLQIYLTDQLVYSVPYPTKSVEKYRINSYDVYAPADGSQDCWYSELPCVNGKNPVLKTRGSTIQKGFDRVR